MRRNEIFGTWAIAMHLFLPFPIFKMLHTLSKCPGGYQILHRGLKLNSRISSKKYKKKKNSPEPVDFPLGS